MTTTAPAGYSSQLNGDGGSKRNIDEMIAHLEEHNPSLLEALRAADIGTYRAPG